MKNIRSDRQGFIGILMAIIPALPLLIGVFAFVVGLSIADSDMKLSLFWIGAGLAIGGFGGTLSFKHAGLSIAGAAGAVLLVIAYFMPG